MSNKDFLFFRRLKKQIRSRFIKHVLRQEVLLKKALTEHNFDPKILNISVDHDKGVNRVNGIELGIKYPSSHLSAIQNIPSFERPLNFYFNGFMGDDEGRKLMLMPFEAIPNSTIISSNDGRKNKLKGEVNLDYFKGLRLARFGLCPHQLDWPGSWSHMWTYRFIDCVLAGAIPVLFRKTPLSASFVSGFEFYWDDEIVKNFDKIDLKEVRSKAESNLKLAKERFLITQVEIEAITNSLLGE